MQFFALGLFCLVGCFFFACGDIFKNVLDVVASNVLLFEDDIYAVKFNFRDARRCCPRARRF